jgi:transposase InsO family protein
MSSEHPDLLGRDFTARNIGEKYVGDITYLPLAGGRNLDLATVIDLCSRKLVGWALADHMRTELVTDALRAAARERGALVGALFHSDHGSVYTSRAYGELCAELGIVQPMGAIGSSADNAAAESFNATLKTGDPRRRGRVRKRGGVAAHGVPVGSPLQHPSSSLTLRERVSERLRG